MKYFECEDAAPANFEFAKKILKNILKNYGNFCFSVGVQSMDKLMSEYGSFEKSLIHRIHVKISKFGSKQEHLRKINKSNI